MIEPPLTKKAAAKYRYGIWAGNPKGRAFDQGWCAWEIYSTDGWHTCQCSRRATCGPENLYCKQHAKQLVGR